MFRIEGTLTPTVVWYIGDDTLHVPLPHGNSSNRKQVFFRQKPSDVEQLTQIVTNNKHTKPKNCNSCKKWFHAMCENATDEDLKKKKWFCNECKNKSCNV